MQLNFNTHENCQMDDRGCHKAVGDQSSNLLTIVRRGSAWLPPSHFDQSHVALLCFRTGPAYCQHLSKLNSETLYWDVRRLSLIDVIISLTELHFPGPFAVL